MNRWMRAFAALVCIASLAMLCGCRKGSPVSSTPAPSDVPPSTPATVESAEIELALSFAPTAALTEAPTAPTTDAPSPVPTDTPAPTDAPLPTPDGLLGGRFDGFCYCEEPLKDETCYVSDTVSIRVTRYDSSPLTKRLVYFVADIHVQDIEALRTASWDGQFGTRAVNGKAWGSFLKMAQKAGAIAAINGDYYTYNIHRGLVIRNGERFAPNPWKPWDGHEILLLLRDGTMQVHASDTFDPAVLDDLDVWQAWEFGPNYLHEDGSAKESFGKAFSDINRANPRTVLGYYEPGHYCFVVVDGRKTGYSNGLTLAETAQLMESLGCKVAFNLDGGQTTQFYWNDVVYNVPYNGGRFTSDIIYLTDPKAEKSEDPMP